MYILDATVPACCKSRTPEHEFYELCYWGVQIIVVHAMLLAV
jgi:hypothetical protein